MSSQRDKEQRIAINQTEIESEISTFIEDLFSKYKPSSNAKEVRLTKEGILSQYNITVDNFTLTEQELKGAVAFIRALRNSR